MQTPKEGPMRGIECAFWGELGKPKAGSTAKQRIARRADWKYPAGRREFGEYWPISGDLAAVILVSEARF
jgi:hypothetical protein